MNVNFTVFIDKILSGEKRQTIRKAGKKWENVKPGDKLTLYTGLRTKQCRKLGEAEVESIEDVIIWTGDYWGHAVFRGKKHLTFNEIKTLAYLDGFKSVLDFYNFFNSHYGEDFVGKIIKWKNFEAGSLKWDGSNTAKVGNYAFHIEFNQQFKTWNVDILIKNSAGFKISSIAGYPSLQMAKNACENYLKQENEK
ncbi:MAG: hypothetical protein J6T16_04755 [Opitutales bacterium]|nr:hypothetical protein [Opitutales bacterium]